MRTIVPALRAAAVVALLALTACAGTSDTAGSDAKMTTGSDSEGSVQLGIVKVSKIDRSTTRQDGIVRYYVDNLSPGDQEDLVWYVQFVFPLRDLASDIAVAEEVETTAERTLILLRGEKGKLLEARCGAFEERRAAGQQIVGTRLNIATNPPVAAIARTPDQPGTRFASNRLECVGQTSIWDDPDQITLWFENVSAARVSDLELQVVFFDTRARSRWRPIPASAPGERVNVTVDLRGLELGARDFLVKVRQQGL